MVRPLDFSLALAIMLAMKNRNNDLLRRILLDADKSDSLVTLTLGLFRDFPDVTKPELNEHIEFLIQRGFLERKDDQCFSVTWDGHDFLGCGSDSATWRTAQVVAGDLAFDCFYTILRDLMSRRVSKIIEEYFKKSATFPRPA